MPRDGWRRVGTESVNALAHMSVPGNRNLDLGRASPSPPRMNALLVAPEELERFRNALHAAVERSSLRSVAAVVGMSPTGLSKLIAGAQPYGKTVERLRAWFYRAGDLNGVAPQETARQLRRMVDTLPEPDRGVENLLETVDRLYQTAGMMPPTWVGCVRALLRTSVETQFSTE